jgi:hypothetical protein
MTLERLLTRHSCAEWGCWQTSWPDFENKVWPGDWLIIPSPRGASAARLRHVRLHRWTCIDMHGLAASWPVLSAPRSLLGGGASCMFPRRQLTDLLSSCEIRSVAECGCGGCSGGGGGGLTTCVDLRTTLNKLKRTLVVRHALVVKRHTQSISCKRVRSYPRYCS